MKSLFTSLWRRFTRERGPQPDSLRTYQAQESWQQQLQDWAGSEQRAREALTSDLLSYAIARREVAEAYLYCWRSLSPREQEVTALICLNYTNRQIARRLVISPQTVKSHVRSLLGKFGLHSKAELRRALADWDFSAWGEPQE
jgi:DNA-binding CsgD family transcriptional regulator